MRSPPGHPGTCGKGTVRRTCRTCIVFRQFQVEGWSHGTFKRIRESSTIPPGTAGGARASGR